MAENAIEPVAVAPTARFVPTADGKTVRDVKSRLTWQRDAPEYAQTAAQAGHYCAELSLNGRGWRLPKREDLLGLAVDFDGVAFPNTPLTWFWTDSPFQGSATTVWGVDFENARANPYDVTTEGRVRCVK